MMGELSTLPTRGVPQTTMQRRKFIAGLGSLAAAGAAGIGTGAFEQSKMDRSMTMKVKDDSKAFTQLQSLDQDFASLGGTNGRTLQIKARLLNDNAYTAFGPLFEIRNNGNVASDQEDYDYYITVASNVFTDNKDKNGDRLVAFDWQDDTGAWHPLNTTDNTKPSNVPVLGPGKAVDVRLTVDTRDWKNKPSGNDYKLTKGMTIHANEVSNA